MPTFVNTHCQNQKKVCLVCLRKSDREITEHGKNLVKQCFKVDLDFSDNRTPLGLCSTYRLMMTPGDKYTLKQTTLYDFQTIFVLPFLRTSPHSCYCLLCKIARSKHQNPSHCSPLGEKKKGRPKSSNFPCKPFLKASPSPKKICPSCLSVVAKGKSHKCNLYTQSQNLLVISEQCSSSAEKVACSIIKQKEASPKGTKRLSQFSGPLFPIVAGSSKTLLEKNSNAPLSVPQMIIIQQTTNLSNNNMRKLASCINKFSSKGGGVEPYFQEKFAVAGKSTQEFFQSSEQTFEKKGKEVKRATIMCKDLESFVWFILEARKVDATQALVKISLDNGGGFFKICLQVVDKMEWEKKASKKSNSILEREGLSSSVKKIFILSIAEDISETFSNISRLLCQMELEKVKFQIAADMKVANLICGLQCHSSQHPCCYCDINSNSLTECGDLRTFGSLRSQAEAFQASLQKSAKLVSY